MSRLVGLPGLTLSFSLSFALLMSGCTGDDTGQDPDVATTAVPTEPQTATAPDEAVPRTTEPPSVPLAAKKNTDVGAEAFVRHWVDVLNYSRSTGYAEELQALSDTSCAGCRGYVESFSTIYGSGGGSIKGGEATLSNLRTVPDSNGADWSGVATIEFAAFTVIESDKTRQRFTADEGRLTVEVVWDADAWEMQVLIITDQS